MTGRPAPHPAVLAGQTRTCVFSSALWAPNVHDQRPEGEQRELRPVGITIFSYSFWPLGKGGTRNHGNQRLASAHFRNFFSSP